jgi:hypothetical protein
MVIVTLILVASMGMWLRFGRHSSGHSDSEMAPNSEVQRSMQAANTHTASEARPQVATTSERLNSDGVKVPQVDAGQRIASSRAANEAVQTAQDQLVSTVAIDRSLVGAQFPVSNSMAQSIRRCAARVETQGPDVCSDVNDNLELIAMEPRDTAWAPIAERGLREMLQSDVARQYEIRNLVCRRTLCAFEVASIYGSYTGPTYDQVKTLRLKPSVGEFAYERTDAGGRVFVTLYFFRRTLN